MIEFWWKLHFDFFAGIVYYMCIAQKCATHRNRFTKLIRRVAYYEEIGMY